MPLQRTNANNTQTTCGYTPDRGFLDTIYTSSPSVVQNLDYDVDPVGMVEQVTSPVTNEAWSYIYDDLYRVTTATNLTTPANSQTWTYHEIGRILSNSSVRTYTYPSVGQARPHALGDVNGVNYAYDTNGTAVPRRHQLHVANRALHLRCGQPDLPVAVAPPRRPSPTSLGRKSQEGSARRHEPVSAGRRLRDHERNRDEVRLDRRPGPGGEARGALLHDLLLPHRPPGRIQAITVASGSPLQRRTYRPYGERSLTRPPIQHPALIDQRKMAGRASATCMPATTIPHSVSSWSRSDRARVSTQQLPIRVRRSSDLADPGGSTRFLDSASRNQNPHPGEHARDRSRVCLHRAGGLDLRKALETSCGGCSAVARTSCAPRVRGRSGTRLSSLADPLERLVTPRCHPSFQYLSRPPRRFRR